VRCAKEFIFVSPTNWSRQQYGAELSRISGQLKGATVFVSQLSFTSSGNASKRVSEVGSMNKLDDKVGFNAWFGKAAARAAGWVGSPWAFILALACVLVWGSLAPLTCFLSPQLQRSQWRTRPLYSQVVPGYPFPIHGS